MTEDIVPDWRRPGEGGGGFAFTLIELLVVIAIVALLAFRHNKRGHLIMADLRVDSLNAKGFREAAKRARFWFPTEDMSGPGGINIPNLQ